jgi:glycosyltransferase involved in cell wall biosynthesis
MRILLVTNYKEDDQKSMLRFGKLLASNLLKNGIELSEVFPKSNIRRFCFGSKLRKWAGYLDKYFLFEKELDSVFKDKSFDLIHIVDHSNSIYLPKLSRLTKVPKVTTCHDMIAILSALGEFPLAPVTSRTGQRLQKWIETSLKESDFYVCDSKQTQSDLIKIIPESQDRTKVIHLGVTQIQSKKNKNPKFDFQMNRYALHVGSGSWYKNRKGVLESFKFHQEKSGNCNDKLILVGPEIQNHEVNNELSNWIRNNKNKLIIIPKISDEDLHSLYQRAALLIFPSFIEGYGWPPLEAYANSCPSVTTKTGAIFEVLKENAFYVDPNNQRELNLTVQKNLLHKNKKDFTNPLPTNEECAQEYALFYKKVLGLKTFTNSFHR